MAHRARTRSALWRLLFLVGALAPATAAAGVDDAPNAVLQAQQEAEARAIAEALTASEATPPTGQRVAPSEVGPGPRGGLQSMNPDISVLLDTAGAAFSAQDPGNMGEHDPQHSGFTLQQLELHIASSVDPFLRLDANLVVTPHGLELEEAFATSLALPLRLQVRAGQFLHRFGRINARHPHAWNFLTQTLVIGKFFGSDGGRGVGAEVSYLLPTPWYAEGVLSVQQATGNCCSRSMTARTGAPRNLVYTLVLEQFFAINDDWGLQLGLSSQTGDWQHGGRTVLAGTDVRLRWRPVGEDRRRAVTLQLESMVRRRSLGAQRLTDVGGFAELQWTLGPSWDLAVRGEAVSGVAPHPGLPEGDPLDPAWTATRQRYAASATYWPTHFSRLRLEASRGQVPWLAAGERAVWGLMLGLEVVVGAHGAHAY